MLHSSVSHAYLIHVRSHIDCDSSTVHKDIDIDDRQRYKRKVVEGMYQVDLHLWGICCVYMYVYTQSSHVQ